MQPRGAYFFFLFSVLHLCTAGNSSTQRPQLSNIPHSIVEQSANFHPGSTGKTEGGIVYARVICNVGRGFLRFFFPHSAIIAFLGLNIVEFERNFPHCYRAAALSPTLRGSRWDLLSELHKNTRYDMHFLSKHSNVVNAWECLSGSTCRPSLVT